MALADVELNEETYHEVDHYGGVDADGEVTDVPADDGGDEVVESGFGEMFVREVEGERDGKTEGQSEDHPLVGASDAEHVF